MSLCKEVPGAAAHRSQRDSVGRACSTSARQQLNSQRVLDIWSLLLLPGMTYGNDLMKGEFESAPLTQSVASCWCTCTRTTSRCWPMFPPGDSTRTCRSARHRSLSTVEKMADRMHSAYKDWIAREPAESQPDCPTLRMVFDAATLLIGREFLFPQQDRAVKPELVSLFSQWGRHEWRD